MVALNFQARFADDVGLGRKRRSIRALRKDGRDPKAGDALHLYTGMRQAGCRKLGDARAVRVRSVQIDSGSILLDGLRLHRGAGCGDPERYESDFALADGFSTVEAMREFFEEQHGLPFKGLLIEW